MAAGGKTVPVVLGIILFFVAISVGELILLRYLGLDVLGELQVDVARGETGQFLFKAFGATAFLFAQPLLLLFLFIKLNETLKRVVINTLTSLMSSLR